MMAKIETLSSEERKDLAAIGRLRGFIERGRLFGVQETVFNSLFPEQKALDKKSLFSVEKISQHSEVEYTEPEKQIARSILDDFGWAKEKDQPIRGRFDMPQLNIAYNNRDGAITTQLNSLEFMKRQDAIGMADMNLQSGEKGVYKMTRGQHVRHMASLVFRDILRAGIKTPDELIARINEDFKRYGFDSAIVGNKNTHHVQKALREAGVGVNFLSDVQKHALSVGLEYAKYLVIFAYIHDERTPAWGDIIMKASGRFAGQLSITYSEDAELAAHIEKMIGLDGPLGKDTGLAGVIKEQGLNPQLLAHIVRSLAREGDSCLGGMLMKNKRKSVFEVQHPELAAQLRAMNAIYPKKNDEDPGKLGASFDEDQTSGTIANLFDIADQILPGGFGYIPRDYEVKSRPLPLGSYYERLAILAYAVATGKTKEDIRQFCKKNNIDEQRLYIARDEFHVGPNFKLQAVAELGGEILPVGIDPGAIKRLMYAFATLTYFHYQSDQRSGLERLLQDIITSVHEQQVVHNRTHVDTHLGSPDESQILKTFLNTTDEGASMELTKTIPALLHIKSNLLSRFSRVSAEELGTKVADITSQGNFYLISQADIYPVDTKPGTLTRDDERNVKPYQDVIRKKKLTQQEGFDSLPQLLASLSDKLKKGSFYHVIELSPEDVDELKREVEKTNPPHMREIVKRAIRYWTLDLPRPGHLNPISNKAMRAQFMLAGENLEYPLMEQNDNSYDISMLMASQMSINAVS